MEENSKTCGLSVNSLYIELERSSSFVEDFVDNIPALTESKRAGI